MNALFRTFTALFLLAFGSFALVAQGLPGFSYQALARNQQGQPIANQAIGVRVGIRTGSISSPVIYQETHNATTDPYGVFSLTIGQGTATMGNFGQIPWQSGQAFLEVGMDTTGGTNYQLTGTTQLLSVPYAQFAGQTQFRYHLFQNGGRGDTVVTICEPINLGSLSIGLRWIDGDFRPISLQLPALPQGLSYEIDTTGFNNNLQKNIISSLNIGVRAQAFATGSAQEYFGTVDVNADGKSKQVKVLFITPCDHPIPWQLIGSTNGMWQAFTRTFTSTNSCVPAGISDQVYPYAPPLEYDNWGNKCYLFAQEPAPALVTFSPGSKFIFSCGNSQPAFSGSLIYSGACPITLTDQDLTSSNLSFPGGKAAITLVFSKGGFSYTYTLTEN